MSVPDAMVAVAIAGVLAATTGVGLGRMSPKFALDRGARTAVMALDVGRMQAITRGHFVDVDFAASAYTVTDIDDNLVLEAGTLPSGVSVSSAVTAPFTPMGTIDVAAVSPPVTVAVVNGSAARQVTVGMTGEGALQ
jgi:hypothetical protein